MCKCVSVSIKRITRSKVCKCVSVERIVRVDNMFYTLTRFDPGAADYTLTHFDPGTADVGPGAFTDTHLHF